MKHLCLLLAVHILATALRVPAGAQTATITESSELFRTYPFGDPNPIPRMGNIYPYFRFEGHTTTPREQAWKVITLENPYIKVLIAPEIGGKILGAFERSTGRAFIYYNNVVKFREIAMRGPWTSGGIEFNFGDIGHAPTTATPVDYLTRTNSDGSVSCFVGTMDLASRTVWRVEIRLPKDKAYFETHSLWYNPTSISTSRYHWMNAAADAAPDLQFVYPGTAYIDHGGEAFAYPIDRAGRDISLYRNNDFGSHKSYHVLGTHTDFFGAYYRERDFGVMHWSRYEEKPGKKIWMWSQARDGEIWVDLLTDPALGNGQYVEIQSGLLFNQAGVSSTETPFKHQSLEPHSQERFSEAWFPVLKTGGVAAANLSGALNLVREGNRAVLSFCPVRVVDEDLVVTANGKEILKKGLRLDPLETVRVEFKVPEDVPVAVTIGEAALTYNEPSGKNLQRPTTAPESFDWNSPTGLTIKGIELARQRDYVQALEFFRRSLEADPFQREALANASECQYRRMDYDAALELATRALQIDAYDGQANYVYGMVMRSLGLLPDAKDGFGRASATAEFRSASRTELAEIAMLEHHWDEAEYFAGSALASNQYDMRAQRILAVVARITRKSEAAKARLGAIEALDPLDHFVRFERYLHEQTNESQRNFKSGIRSELPHESFLELAVEYFALGLAEEAALVLELAPEQPMVNYWRAFLAARLGEGQKSVEDLERALGASPELVFPHRSESQKVLEWAETQKPHWKTRYYLGLLAWSRGRSEEALAIFTSCGDQPDFAPFYISRAALARQSSVERAERDYRRAVDVGPTEWRTYRSLASFYGGLGQFPKSLTVLSAAAGRFPMNALILFDYAQTLLHNDRSDESLAILDTLVVLPFEGARYGRQTYREACVLSALAKIKAGDHAGALPLVAKAREWPEHLGVGRPYDVDERIEDYVEAYCREQLSGPQEAKRLHEKIAMETVAGSARQGSVELLAAATLRRLGRAAAAETIIKGWVDASSVNPVAGWCLAAYEGDGDGARRFLEKSENRQQPQRWYTFPDDPDYLLVSRIVETIGTH